MPLSVTLDTSVLIQYIDDDNPSSPIHRILEASSRGDIDAIVSSRVFYPDVDDMREEQRAEMRTLLNEKDIETQGPVFRVGMSPVGNPPRGGDTLGHPSGSRPPEEIERFKHLVGPPPSTREDPEINDVADYDALRDHYAFERDAFLTFDSSGYLAEGHPERYETELGLIIMEPEEFIERFGGGN